MKYDVCVIGGCSLDQTFFQKVDGSYPDVADTISPGGKGANQAVAAAKAGAKTVMLSRLGKDDIGKKILDNLNFYHVDTSYVEIDDKITNDYSNIYIQLQDKDNDIVRFSGAINSFTPDMIDRYQDILLRSKIIACQLKVPKEVTKALIEFCDSHKKTLVLTPCRPEKLNILEEGNLELIDKISIITCNQKECSTIFGTEDVLEVVKKYPNKLIVTLGSEGLVYYNGTRVVHMPAISTDVVDTTGAGDTLNGNLCAFLSKGMDLEHALRKAMYASAMKLTKSTAQAGMPYLEDLENYIQTKRNRKFAYHEELDLALQIMKDAYDIVRYTTQFQIHTKADHTLVTSVDLAIEEYLTSKIKEKFPNDNFVTEEFHPTGKLCDRSWVIDPIDGTAHFVKKDGLWGIQLAFYDKEDTRFSVIYLPEKKELYYAAENIGAFLNNNKILLGDEVPLEQAVLEFGGSIYKEMDTKKMVLNKIIQKNHLILSNVLQINACCISYTNLASRRTDALVVSTVKPWDIMPGEFICRMCHIPHHYLDGKETVRLFTRNQKIVDAILSK